MKSVFQEYGMCAIASHTRAHIILTEVAPERRDGNYTMSKSALTTNIVRGTLESAGWILNANAYEALCCIFRSLACFLGRFWLSVLLQNVVIE
eukprot:2482749-Amphidinium_carterae.1